MTKKKNITTGEAAFNSANATPFFEHFHCLANTDFGEFLGECANFLHGRPDLAAEIEADLDCHGLEKKRLREADRRFLLERSRSLEGFGSLPESRAPQRVDLSGNKLPSKLEFLEEGRPRLPAEVVGVLLLVRGYKGSCTDKEALDFMGESKSLEAFLAEHHQRLPARSTLSELLNAVTLHTRESIFRAHLEQARQEELDGFEQALIDSTAAKANSCWPTDAKTIFTLTQGLVRLGARMELFGLDNIRPGRTETYLEKVSNLPFQINLNARKKNKFQKLCRDFIEQATKLVCHADKEHERLKESWEKALESGNIRPSVGKQARERVENFRESLHLATKALEQMRQRIFEDKTFPSTERVLSVHDRSAAYIQKGGRQPVIGYKPQLARSGNGYVVALMVEEGNISDSTSLLPMVNHTIVNTGVTPRVVSADDGYSSRVGHDAVKEKGVDVVSISGSKGKKLLGDQWDGEEYRLARADRSAVESLMFCLKHNFEFGQLSRTGITAAREEFLEKCMAYNICRTIMLRKRKQKQQPRAA